MKHGLDLPPRGSVRDQYIQEFVLNERQLEFDRLLFTTIMSRPPGDNASDAGRQAYNIYERVSGAIFPFLTKFRDKEKQKQVKVAEALHDVFGASDEEVAAAEAMLGPIIDKLATNPESSGATGSFGAPNS